MKSLRLGTRGSRLARAQSEIVRRAIQALQPDCSVETILIGTRGDRDQSTPLEQLGGTGVFVKEIEQALLNGTIDLAVHSAKDLPLELAEGLDIGAILPRGDPRDVLITRAVDALTYPQRIGTSSVRRRAAMRQIFPLAETPDIRGNIDTRLQKLRDGVYDALVLAKAGLERAGLFDEPDLAYRVFSVDEVVPAACQGLLAIEGREGEYGELLTALNDEDAHLAFDYERGILALLGGDCSRPIGAYAQINSDEVTLTIDASS